ncbi:MAG: hypothetical protein MJ080_04050, partial [Clostridia bacterium]|nr:hypothetical protein [Clostridia bacterium]
MKNTKKLLALIVSFAIAFTCFVCVPFNAFAAGTVTANTVSDFRTALADSSVDHIIINTTINDDTVTVTRALTLEGAAGIDWHI